MTDESSHNTENRATPPSATTDVWPPPPTTPESEESAAAAALTAQEVKKALSRCRLFLILGILLFSPLMIGTICYGVQANRKGGRGQGTGYIVTASGLLGLSVVIIIVYALIS